MFSWKAARPIASSGTSLYQVRDPFDCYLDMHRAYHAYLQIKAFSLMQFAAFLRFLEYYSGFLFLTTNRIKALDSAFESRIDISLAYDEHDRASRAQIWRSFLYSNGTNGVDIDEEAINKLVSVALNGRQIKSAVKTALILAAKENVQLGLMHLDVVLKLRAKAVKLLDVGSVDASRLDQRKVVSNTGAERSSNASAAHSVDITEKSKSLYWKVSPLLARTIATLVKLRSLSLSL